MERDELYQKIQEEGLSLPSSMILTPYDAIENYSFDNLIKKLEALDFIEAVHLVEDEGVLEGAILIDSEPYSCSFFYEPFEDDTYKNFLFQVSGYNQMQDGVLPNVMKAEGNITFNFDFHDDKRAGYLLQLRILMGICDCVAAVYDESAYKILPIEQIKYLLSMETPPAYNVLFNVHITYDEDGTYWLHTHGLNRCGMIELEILKVKDFINQYYELLKCTATIYLEKGLPQEDEHTLVGYASMANIEVKWTPWEKALETETKRHLFQKKSVFCGSLKDREDGHNTPSGILYAYYENKFQPITVYEKFLDDNPILFISDEETLRMAAYAKEAIQHFRVMFEEQKDNEDYCFMIKAGMDVDNHDEMTGDHEHVWFEISDLKEDTFYGELINEPYGISTMKCGESYEVSLDRLSDYLIFRKDASALTPADMYLYYMEDAKAMN